MRNEITYFLIAYGGGTLRYLSSVMSNKIKYKILDMILWGILSGGIGILAGWLAPYFTDQTNIQYAIIYVSGMVSAEIIKIISDHIPDLLSNRIKKGM